MKKIITALALAACAITASAADYSLVIHGVSHHFSERQHGKWNELNYGAALRVGINSDLSAQAGVYRNSESATSAYALADYAPIHIGAISLGAFGGVATGYEARNLTPIAGAVVRVKFDRVSVAVRLAPKAGVGGSAVASIEAGFSF